MPLPNFFSVTSLTRFLRSEDTQKKSCLLAKQQGPHLDPSNGQLARGWEGRRQGFDLIGLCFQIFTLVRVWRKLNEWEQTKRERVPSRYREVAILQGYD